MSERRPARGGVASKDAWRGIAEEQPVRSRGSAAALVRSRSRRLLGSLLVPHRRSLGAGSVLVLVNAGCAMAGPYLIRHAIDDGVVPLLRGASPGGLYVVVAAYAAVAVCDAASLRAYITLTGRTGERILYDLRTRVFDHVQRLSVSFHERYTSGRIMARLTNDIDALSELLGTGMVAVPTAMVQLFGIAAIMLVMDAKLAAVTLAVFPAVAALTWWFRRHSEVTYRRIREAVALVIVHFTESLGGIRAVQAFRREARNQEIFEDAGSRYRDANMRSIELTGIFGPGVNALGKVAVALCLLYGGTRVLRGEMTVGVLAAFVLYLRQFFQPMLELSQFYNTFQSAGAALEQLSGLLEEKPSVPEPAEPVVPVGWSGAVAFDAVTFGYREKPVLQELSFEVPAGQTVALVGPTGAGKSTIARLVARFYDPTSGRVTLDGIDLRDVPNGSLRRGVSMVTQEGYLFAGTVAANIAFARPEASRQEIEAAARAVGADTFIEALPDGYDTDVRKRGGRLSAGQRQLVALARAFLAAPQVLIVDEATSSVDLPSERRIQEALGVVLAGRTAFIIAHRLSTVEIADRVLVIEDGRIVEDGPPAALLADGGRWAALHEAWLESIA